MLLWFVERKIGAMELDASNPGRGEVLNRLGLSGVASEHANLRAVEGNTPSGKPGTIIAFPNGDLSGEEQLRAIGYWPERQEWVKCSGGAYWCGKSIGESIAPDTLRRADAIPGFPVKLADGHEWEIARAVYQGGRGALVRRISIDDEGRLIKTCTVPRFTDLDIEARKFFAIWLAACDSGEDPEIPVEDLVRLAVLGLQANYRIGRDEAVGVLGLFDEDNVWGACLATISWPAVVAMVNAEAESQKKTA